MHFALRIPSYSQPETINLGQIDISGCECASVDFRRESGGPAVEDRTRIVPPGAFTLSVLTPAEGSLPVGEILVWFAGRSVSIVGALTGREGVIEVTPEHLQAMAADGGYQKTITQWIATNAIGR